MVFVALLCVSILVGMLLVTSLHVAFFPPTPCSSAKFGWIRVSADLHESGLHLDIL